MILDRRPGEPLGASLDRAVESGKLHPGDAEQIETFGDLLTYGPRPSKSGGVVGNRRQLRWLAAFVRTARGGEFYLGTTDRDEAARFADRLERIASGSLGTRPAP